jgi:peptide chain release factor 2
MKIRQKRSKAVRSASPSSEAVFDLAGKEKRIADLESRSSRPDFWNNREAAQEATRELKQLRQLIEPVRKLHLQSQDLLTLVELAREEEDESVAEEIEQEAETLAEEIQQAELALALAGAYDTGNCFLHIHPGAGGTESCDWAEMLFRMYLRYLERKEFGAEVLESQPGDEAGLKSVTIQVEGDMAYGTLKSESGIHRLVRISPFDANARRHTSFAAVFVMPEIEDDIEVKVEDRDLRVDTFASSGAGGQHVNRTYSAVRITHLPTGIVVQCQNERSQHQNRATAMKVLRSRLYELQQQALKEQADKLAAGKKEIAWGNQIRSYVFQPYSLVKDHRTAHETGNVQAVMDGNLDQFVEAYLRWSISG